MKDDMKILYIWHSVYLESGDILDPNYSMTYGLLKYPENHRVVRHSLYRGGESRIYKNDIYKKIWLIGKLSDPIRYIIEIIVNIFYLIIFRPDVVVAIDPLSCFSPTLFKKIGLTKKVIFITPDFSRQRFNNKLLNKLYFSVDKFCTLNSNVNICCSATVIDYKKSIYKNLDNKKFFHYPNIPSQSIIDNMKNLPKIKNRIIYVGTISSQIDFKHIFDAIFKLKKKCDRIHLAVVGSGDQEEDLKNYLMKSKIDNVHFLGQLSHEDTLEEIAKSEIGIALYNGNFNYNEFGDSCKIREYQALSVIPIASKIVKANASEISRYDSGILIDNNEKICCQINKILSDENYKKELQENAIKNYLIYTHKYGEINKIIYE